ncbi:sensor histidine kinase [Bordetella petrii]|nr:sensor histidine kinase [Bordetella petrii]
MSGSSANSFLRTLCSLRWLAIAGQAATVLVASGLLGLELPLRPLWSGVAVLVAFNIYASLRVRRSRGEIGPGVAFAHLLVDIAVLAWMVGWSGGIHNPFGLMFLILIALAALALPRGWALAAALACLLGYAASALLGQPLQGHHNPYALILWGIATSFLISAMVVLTFTTRLAADLRSRERELALLRERFTRNEGIVALATHAAAMAHELNTPLATMALLADEIAAEVRTDDLRADVALLGQLLALCRERIRNLAVPTEVDLVRVVGQWRLVRPTIDLQRTGELPASLRVEPAIAHLLQALLNNAADAGEAAGHARVDLHLEYRDGALRGEVRDHGRGFDPDHSLLPATSLFHSGKPGGLGVGLALSHATVEQLGGEMTMTAADGGGARIRFYLPLEPRAPRASGTQA